MTIKKLMELANDIYDELGIGHAECVYQNAMEVALRESGARFDSQRDVAVIYHGHHVGRGIADIVLLDDGIVVELKAVPYSIGPTSHAQIRNYMKSLGIKSGLIVNFIQQGKRKAGVEFVDIN